MSQSLDELQAYILLRRWLTDEGEVIVDTGLSAQQRRSLQAYYFSERNYILRCLDGLLQFGSGMLLACSPMISAEFGCPLFQLVIGSCGAG